jgi:excisionase family DNA binding protein
MSKLFAIKEAASVLGVSDKSIRRLVRSGKLPASRIGGVYRIPRGALCALLCPRSPRICSVSGGSQCELSKTGMRDRP